MSLLDDVLLAEDEAQAAFEAAALARPSKERVVFTTARGALDLGQLNRAEVTDLYNNGKLTDDELKRWSMRSNALRLPLAKKALKHG